ncbi:MAG: GIY-YIG nuclease family protein [Thermoplasmata archaeon]
MGYSKRHKKEDLSRVPNTSGIYRLYHGNTVVYVGQAKNLRRRISQHERRKSYWGSYDYKSTRNVPTRKRKTKERNAIKSNRPTRQK